MRNNIGVRSRFRLDLGSSYGLELLKNSEKLRLQRVLDPTESDGVVAIGNTMDAVEAGVVSSFGRER